MPASRYEPLEIRNVPEKRQLHIEWADGHEAFYDFEYLRTICPCATCRAARGQSQAIQARGVRILRIDEVGNYAVSFNWSDGHHTGIYSLEFLRANCPCPECRPEAPPPAA